MATLVLKAHFDGEQIRLEQPFELPVNVPLTACWAARISWDVWD